MISKMPFYNVIESAVVFFFLVVKKKHKIMVKKSNCASLA